MPYANTLPENPTAEQVRDALMGAGQYVNGLARATERGEGFEADLRSGIAFIHTYDPVLTAFERGMAPTPAPIPGQGPSGATAQLNPGFRSLGAMAVEDAAYIRLRDAHESGSTFATVEIRGSAFNHNEAYRALVDSGLGAGGTSNSGELLPQGTPVLPHQRQRRLFVRDVISVQETSLASVPYIREYNPEVNVLGASAVAEGQAKPEVQIQWDPDDAPVRKIAAWIPVTTEIIDDVPTLQGYINNRLTYSLAVREELQILNGTGVSPQLKGILQYSVQTQSFVAGDQVGTLGMAIGKIEAVDGEPDAIAIEPITFWTMVTSRHATQFDNGFGGNAPFNSPASTPWGLPTIRSRAVAANTAVVGSWRMGATLFDRMQSQIRIGNQHSDFFTTNKVAILIEERVALAVHRADFFCVATLA